MIDLIAHRGDRAHAPENTLSAFCMAKQKGADCVEFDVMLTQDGCPIIMHDDTLDRTTNGSGLVSERDLAYIKSLDAGSWFDPAFKSEPVPTLAAVIDLLVALDLNANIEIKPCGNTAILTAKKAIEIIKTHWPKDKKPPLLSSFNQDSLAVCLAGAPEYPRALLLDEWRDDSCALAADLNCSSINCDYSFLTKDRIECIKSKGFLVYAYTVNDPIIAAQLDDWGVNGLFSDDPTLFGCSNLIQKSVGSAMPHSPINGGVLKTPFSLFQPKVVAPSNHAINQVSKEQSGDVLNGSY